MLSLMEDMMFIYRLERSIERRVYKDEGMAAWIDVIGSAKFYPAAKAEWADVKQGVIAVQQEVLLGGDAQELLDALQAEIAG